MHADLNKLAIELENIDDFMLKSEKDFGGLLDRSGTSHTTRQCSQPDALPGPA